MQLIVKNFVIYISIRVRTVQPKMSPGTVRELCIFGPARTGPVPGPGRSGDFHHYCSNPSASLYGS